MESTSTSNSDFEPLVVEYLQLWSRWLTRAEENKASTESSIPLSNFKTAAEQQPDLFVQEEVGLARVSLDEAGQLDGGSFMLPPDRDVAAQSWYVFIRNPLDLDFTAIAFALVGRIETVLPLAEFIRVAHRLVLGRDIDVEDLRTYKGLMEAGRLHQRDFLKMLASREETQERNMQIFIVPEPSRWLDLDASCGKPSTRLAGAVADVSHGFKPTHSHHGPVKEFPITLKFDD